MPKTKLKPRADGRYRKIVDGVSFYGTSEREVYQKIKEYTEEKAAGRRFEVVADEWWELEVVSLAPSSVKGYKKATERALDFFGKMRIKEITTADVTRFLYDLGKRKKLAKKTVKNHKIVVSRILHYAVAMGEIPYNPAHEAELPLNLKETERLPAPPEEEITVANASDVWLLPFFALFTGMRKGELRGLKWCDVDLAKKLIRVQRSVWDGGGTHIKEPKTKAGIRYIPIPDILLSELEKCDRNPNHYVFGDENPLSEKAYRYRFQKFQKQTGITATAQQLRKSYATMATGAKLPLEVLAAIFGHRDVSTTLNIYNQVREDRIIAAADQLNAAPLAATAPSSKNT